MEYLKWTLICIGAMFLRAGIGWLLRFMKRGGQWR
jgi:hypothetical protein